MRAPKFKPGQFLVRKPEFTGWGIGKYVRVTGTYSETITDLFVCAYYGMQMETGWTWSWGRSKDFPVQICLANLKKYYRPVTEAEAAVIAEDELRNQQARYNADFPRHAGEVVIREFGKLRPERFTPEYLTSVCGRGKISI